MSDGIFFRLQHRCFSVKSAKFLWKLFLKNTHGRCFCLYQYVSRYYTEIKRNMQKHPQKMFCKKGVLKKVSQKLQESTCAKVSFFIKLHPQQHQPATFLKKRVWRSCFPVDFGKFLRAPFLQNSSETSVWIKTNLAVQWNAKVIQIFLLQDCNFTMEL